jgi:hypothetical protein
MKSEKDPAVFWRDNSMYHQERANFWRKTSRILAGVLTGIILVAWYALS